VGCEECREALSARLDGEDQPDERASVDAHLEVCAACRRWLDDAARVTRLARVHLAPSPVAVEVGRPAKRRPRLVKALRLTLGAFGAAQFVLGIAQVGDATSTGHVEGTTPGHLWHESAAWNVAIGAGFAWIALRRVRPSGALPMLTAFVALLTLLSVNDITAGRVDSVRLLSHGFVVAGFAIVVALTRPSLDPGLPPPGRQGPPWRWRPRRPVAVDTAAVAGPPSLRLIKGQPSVESPDRIAA
jgi:predicted anti-sigma-YlaC factor YlaD